MYVCVFNFAAARGLYPDLSDHDKLSEEAREAEKKKQTFPPARLAQHRRKQVDDGRHHHLHGNKLEERTGKKKQVGPCF